MRGASAAPDDSSAISEVRSNSSLRASSSSATVTLVAERAALLPRPRKKCRFTCTANRSRRRQMHIQWKFSRQRNGRAGRPRSSIAAEIGSRLMNQPRATRPPGAPICGLQLFPPGRHRDVASRTIDLAICFTRHRPDLPSLQSARRRGSYTDSPTQCANHGPGCPLAR